MTKVGGELSILPMKAEEIDELVLIEQDITPCPWTPANFVDSLVIGHQGRILRDEQGIRAYAVISTVLDEAELLLIGVARSHQGKGYGQLLMRAIISELLASGVKHLYLEVRESNAPALALYRSLGFEQTGRRAAYYPLSNGVRESALLMTKTL